MFRKNIIKIPLSLTFVFVFFICSTPMTSFADNECPCFTAQDLKRFTPPSSPRTCFYEDVEEEEPYDLRISKRGEYVAAFSTTGEICGGCSDDLRCGAYVGIGDLGTPTVVLIGDEYGYAIDIQIYDLDQFSACRDLLYADEDRIGVCDYDPFDP